MVVFHGHDHLDAQQECDGIVYQLVPQSGHTRYDNTRSAEEYGYKSGVIAGASGLLRVKVEPEESLVEYVVPARRMRKIARGKPAPDLDNTVIFRTRIDKPGWKLRWNTKPDLDVSGAPVK